MLTARLACCAVALAVLGAGAGADGVSVRVALLGAGSGKVTSVPAGLVCRRAACVAHFQRGTTVVLRAGAGTSSSFKGWGGACIGLSRWCTLVTDGDVSVSARFVRQVFGNVGQLFVTRPLLNVTRSGAAGEIRSSPGGIVCPPIGSCSTRFDRGTRVTLTAVAPAGYELVRWSGLLVACAGSGPCVVKLNTTLDVTATFRRR